jgi:hypothetical protein
MKHNRKAPLPKACSINLQNIEKQVDSECVLGRHWPKARLAADDDTGDPT